MRKPIGVVVAVAVTATIFACSGSDPLKPAPTAQQGGNHGSDTAIVSGPSTPPSVPPVVSSFALSGAAYGHVPGPDTMQVVLVPNTTLTLVKVAGVNGDTLVPSVTVASTTTNAQGTYRLENLAPAYYRIDVAAPAGSRYANTTGGIGPARETEVRWSVSLPLKP